ncbi:uncharacterized protein PV07_01406 [Cladophialophora immunda]|uniref:Heterokaryon incompatibility domain-containing protein n=1 Tax=Cladophialophora immunda TaxID=569365 RepID=A0A0D2DFZ7_9EURO|nr:uncharacterized protein PV07_01406 [Cladophialophora immunda]KIW34639.1 hypothetical protein PV07_01406 [Cladophialophora immunda]
MALVRLCSCKEYNGRHFSIETKETELRESIGVTISYTWGEFDRQDHHIGHFCNPQSDEAIRKTLSAIPTIYKTLDIFVIIPGPVCSCLPTAYRAFEAAKQALDDPLSTTAEVETLCKAALKHLSTAVEADVHRP